METKAGLDIGGVFNVEHIRDGKVIDSWTSKNIVVNEGLDYIVDTAVVNGTQVATWYCGLFKGNYTPDGTETGATIATDSTEATEYDELVRQTYVPAAVTSQSTTNSANKATFTISTGGVTVYGAFLAQDSAKSGTTGKALCISRFPGSRVLLAADELLVTYTITASDVV
mgnify:CR=1 FL=1